MIVSEILLLSVGLGVGIGLTISGLARIGSTCTGIFSFSIKY